MTLRDLIDGVAGATLIGDGGVEIREVTADSRAVAAGDVFVAVRGRTVDGHQFVDGAIERGAAAVVVEAERPGLRVPQVVVTDGADALGELTARALGSPAEQLVVVGITGTNGKTTSTYLLESILVAAGQRPGVIGTVNYRWEGHRQDAPYSTPTPAVLHRAFAGMVAAGCTHAVLEVTSSALEQARLAGIRFAVGAFSNLTQDHLDVHGTMAAYRDAKRLLFTRYLARDGTAVANIDDPEGEGMLAGVPRALRVTTDPAKRGDITVADAESTIGGISATVHTPRGALRVASRPLIGDYNIANVALVIGIAEALGLPRDAIARGIAEAVVPGRVERVANTVGLDLFVDYAHTPDALRNVLAALRPLTQRRLICVFGCGGDRDPTKRPKMGAAVAELADLAIVTSDNPRTEEPRAIIDMILPAVPAPFFVDPDRRTAIRAAVAEATPGDVVLIAGKGHEDYQILGTTKIHFDDREEAAAAVALRPRWTPAEIATIVGAAAEQHGESPNVTRVVIDGRLAAPGDLYVAIRGEHHDGHAFCDQAYAGGSRVMIVEADRAKAIAAALVPDPPALIEVAATRIALGALGQAHRRLWAAGDPMRRLVAITGSSGKTTTKELARAALGRSAATLAASGSLNNETGVPLTLLAMRAHHRYAVVEMGMRGPGQIEYLTRLAEPDVAVVVNAGTAHIELLGTTDAIAQAKGEIWVGLRPGGVIVRPVDDDRLAHWALRNAPAGTRTLTFGDVEGADVRLVGHRYTTAAIQLDVVVLGRPVSFSFGLLGRHAAIDACAALAAAIAAGADLETAVAGLARARPPAMRGELVDVAGRHVIVDCYNANPSSMAAALDTFAEVAPPDHRVAILGDMLELGARAEAEHRAVGARAAELGLGVVALGEWKHVITGAAGGGATTDDPDEAARRALAMTASGDWILIKASRGMRLERVLDAMKREAG